MVRLLFLMALTLVSNACGKGSKVTDVQTNPNQTTGVASVTGNANGTAFAPMDAVFYTQSLGHPNATILVSSTADLCSDLNSKVLHKGETFIVFNVEDPNASGATLTTQGFSISTDGSSGTTAGYLFPDPSNPTCPTTSIFYQNEYPADTGGTVNVTTISTSSMSATFTFTFSGASGGFTGSFEARYCPAAQPTPGTPYTCEN